LHDEDVAVNFGGASMNPSLARKFSLARREWTWQYVFPAKKLGKDPRSGEMLRHHALANSYQDTCYEAALRYRKSSGSAAMSPLEGLCARFSRLEPKKRS
jgi:hypothetical protein